MTLATRALSSGTHFQGPLLARSDAHGGLYENIPLGHVDRVRSRYKTWLETFDSHVTAAVSTTSFPSTSGWTTTDLNTATTPLAGIAVADRCMILDAGTKANSGTLLQFNAAVATQALHTTKLMGPIVGVDPVWDNTELIWAARVGFRSNATTWDGIGLVGLFVTDTTPFNTTTGVPSIATGGGFGFHIGITGTITYVGAQTAITAVGTTTGYSVGTLDAANAFNWVDLGFRVRFLDTSAGTGSATYYVNGRNVGSITTDLPTMATTYSNTLACCNGAAQLSDLGFEYIYNACTAAGRTNTSV